MSIAPIARSALVSLVTLCARRLRRPAEAGSKACSDGSSRARPDAERRGRRAAQKRAQAEAAEEAAGDCPKGPNVTFEQKAVEDEVRRKLPKPTATSPSPT